MTQHFPTREGYEKLWGWFGLSYASFCVMPRVLMHAMPDDWQAKMAELLEQWDAAWNKSPEGIDGLRVQATCNGRLVKWPSQMLNYRHPDAKFIKSLKAGIK